MQSIYTHISTSGAPLQNDSQCFKLDIFICLVCHLFFHLQGYANYRQSTGKGSLLQSFIKREQMNLLTLLSLQTSSSKKFERKVPINKRLDSCLRTQGLRKSSCALRI